MRILCLNTECCAEAQLLDLENYEVIVEASFEEALKLLATNYFDVLLIDGAVDADTVQFVVDARIVRPDVPIFVASAWGDDLARALRSLESTCQPATAC